MGRFKRDGEVKANPIHDWLIKQEYEEGSGYEGQKGLVKLYNTDNDLYSVSVSINLSEKKIYVYRDLNCGGYEGSDVYDIKDEWLEDLDLFIDEVDRLLESWIG